MLKVSSWENLVDMAVSSNKQALGSIVAVLCSSPNVDGCVNDQFELLPLLLFGEQVAFHRRSETTLPYDGLIGLTSSEGAACNQRLKSGVTFS